MSIETRYYRGAFKYVGMVKILLFFFNLKLHEVMLRVRSVSRRNLIEEIALQYSELHKQRVRAKTFLLKSAHRSKLFL